MSKQVDLLFIDVFHMESKVNVCLRLFITISTENVLLGFKRSSADCYMVFYAPRSPLIIFHKSGNVAFCVAVMNKVGRVDTMALLSEDVCFSVPYKRLMIESAIFTLDEILFCPTCVHPHYLNYSTARVYRC